MKTKGKLVTKTKPPQVIVQEDSDSSVYSDLEKEVEASESSEEDDSEVDESSDHSKEDYFDSSDESCPELVPIESEKDTGKDAPQEDKISVISVASEDTPQTVNKFNEYEEDSSDEEDIRNTVGNIPMEWYNEFPHLGYDILGNRVMKPATDDEIDEFLNKTDDPNYWRTVRNRMTGEKVVLTDEDCEFIRRIQRGHYPTGEDQYKPWEDFFTYETMKHPVTNAPPHKRSFIPSLNEKQKVGRMVYAIKMGYIRPRKPKEKENEFYMLWDKESSDVSKRMQHYIPAPKRKLPGHEESYNPPPEYLFTKEEEEKWQEQEPEDRKLDFVPQKFDCLRRVPAYSQFINESFERCLDLYLCSRQRKMRVNVDPSDLIPQLPKPRDLQPFPTVQSLVYLGHTNMVRCITVEPQGQFLASGSDDNTVKVWEVLTGRCLRTINVGGIVKSISWCPNEAICLLLVAVKENVFIINPNVGDRIIISNTDALLESLTDIQDNEAVQWSRPPEEQMKCGIKLVVAHMKDVKQVVWHAKGDYFATLAPAALTKGVVIHQLSQCRSQVPFRRLKAEVQSILFHPLRPFFFLATKTHVKVFNLLKQAMTKKLITNCKWVSSMAIHPHGDNLIIGTYDCRLSWFDLVLSTKPYKTLKHHKKAVRQVAFHKRYPLFASASDDGSLIICHGMVYSDLLQNPLIVPVKVLKGHKAQNDLYVLDCCFHPSRPWVFSSGADNTIILYT